MGRVDAAAAGRGIERVDAFLSEEGSVNQKDCRNEDQRHQYFNDERVIMTPKYQKFFHA